MLGWLSEPRHYFQAFEDIINSVFLWIMIGFIAINVAAFVVCLVLHIKDPVEHEIKNDFGIAVWVNVVGLLAVFALACAVFGAGVFFSEQDYNMFGYYYGSLTQAGWNIAIASVVAVAVAVLLIVIFCSHFDNQVWAVILGLLCGAAAYPIWLFGIGAIGYFLVWLVWLILRFLWVILSTFGISMYSFAVTHYLVLVLTILVPAVLYALIRSLIGYVASLRQNVKPERVGSPRFDTGSDHVSLTLTESGEVVEDEESETEEKDNDIDFIIDD